MYTCADCKMHDCEEQERNPGRMPKNCPQHDKEYLEEIYDGYISNKEINKFYVATKSCGVANRPSFTPRLRVVIELCKKMGYKKIGFAFCVGFKKEAALYAGILRRHGLEVVSVCCLNGGFNIADYGVKLPEGCEFDPACNPLGQARLMNEQKVEFNLVMGLCCGHDSMFMKAADAMSTVVAVKDPATGHNPVMALHLYDAYYKPYLEPDEAEC